MKLNVYGVQISSNDQNLGKYLIEQNLGVATTIMRLKMVHHALPLKQRFWNQQSNILCVQSLHEAGHTT